MNQELFRSNYKKQHGSTKAWNRRLEAQGRAKRKAERKAERVKAMERKEKKNGMDLHRMRF